MKVIWSQKAVKEFDDVYKYCESHNHSNTYSEKLLDEVLRMINLLIEQPKIGILSDRNNIRRILILENFFFIILLMKKISESFPSLITDKIQGKSRYKLLIKKIFQNLQVHSAIEKREQIYWKNFLKMNS